MKLARSLLTFAVCISALAWGPANASDPKYRRLKDHAGPIDPGYGVLIFSQIKTSKNDPVWAFDFGPVGAVKKSSVGREFRWPTGFYDIGCDRVGSVVAISLLPGQYELGPWKIDPVMLRIGPIWSVGKKYKGPEETTMLIPIVAGQLTYAGQISIDEEAGNIATIEDRFDCERSYLAATWPWALDLPATRLVRDAQSE